MIKNELCHCGQPLHYWCKETEEQMHNLINKMGRYVNVTVGNKTYKVDRHFIALHGIKGDQIDNYGFEIMNNEHDG